MMLRKKFKNPKIKLLICTILISTGISCKKNDWSDNQLEPEKALELVNTVKKTYEANQYTSQHQSRFNINWENYHLEGDSILVVQNQGLHSLDPTKKAKTDLAMVSGFVFKLDGDEIKNVKLLEFYSKKSIIQGSGLALLAHYDQTCKTKLGVDDGIYLQYSPRHFRRMGGSIIKNGKLIDNTAVLEKSYKSTQKQQESSETLRSGEDCDPVYLIVYIKQTGQVISQTLLYNTCDEEGDSKEDVNIPIEQPEDTQQCEEVANVLRIEEASETNNILISPEIDNTRSGTYEWVVMRNNFGYWDYRSTELAKERKVGDKWTFESLEHLTHGMVGVTPATEITIDDWKIIPTVGTYYAGVTAYFNITAKILCQSKYNPIPGFYRKMTVRSPLWHVDEIY